MIPCYNQGEFILEAVSELQNYKNHESVEIIIVNDGSTEPLTQKVLNYLKENGYQVIDQINQGLAQARNTGISKALGRYILPLDADNKVREKYIVKSIEILDNSPEIGVVYGDAEFFGAKTGVWQVPEFDINRLALGNYIDACAVFRKTVWKDCGGYDPKIPDKLGYEDWDFWLGVAEQGWKFYHIPEVMFDYRVRSESMVSACNLPENRKQLFRYICTKHLGLYTTNFANIFAEKEFALLRESAHSQSLQWQVKQTQADLDRARMQLQQTQAQLQAELVHRQTQLAQTQSELEKSQTQLQQTQTELKQSQTELENRHNQLQQTQAELDRIQGELGSRHNELQQTQTQLDRIQDELVHCQNHLQQTQLALESSQATVAAMETSKFWKLRAQWFKLKKVMGLKHEP
ncbi:MAG: glycosyltransferase [Microcoleus vaginatus WJT46-NPBG5]|nr:glycosyltransferase [Microcoleus vaginatus WJT46-NPBG5]